MSARPAAKARSRTAARRQAWRSSSVRVRLISTSGSSLVDRLLAGVEDAIVHGDELPPVGLRAQRQLQHAKLIEPRVLAVGRVLRSPLQLTPAGADDEFAEACGIGDLVGPLRREALVVMRVAIEHQLAPCRVQLVEEPARLLR